LSLRRWSIFVDAMEAIRTQHDELDARMDWLRERIAHERAHRRDNRPKRRAPSRQMRAEQHARQKGRCFYCKRPLRGILHMDHVMPVALGGPNTPVNFVAACPTCNMKKKDKHPMDFCGRML
jgi:5-methylcytosine-specific restriction endonuclease McrA